MAAINAINKAPVRSAKAYVARAKKEEVVLPPKPRAKTTEEIVNEVPFINEPHNASHRLQLSQYLNSPNLRGLLGEWNSNRGYDRPWTREDMIQYYTEYIATYHQNWLAGAKEREAKAKKEAERKAALEEKKKNWNPTDAEKLAHMKTYYALRNKTDGRGAVHRMDSFCTCCGMLNVEYPGLENAKRMRWEVVADGAEMHKNHNAESLRIKDAETGKDMIISWDNE
jgi:hypothetical protein